MTSKRLLEACLVATAVLFVIHLFYYVTHFGEVTVVLYFLIFSTIVIMACTIVAADRYIHGS